MSVDFEKILFSLFDALICCDFFMRCFKVRGNRKSLVPIFIGVYAFLNWLNFRIVMGLHLPYIICIYESVAATILLALLCTKITYEVRFTEHILYFGIIYVCQVVAYALCFLMVLMMGNDLQLIWKENSEGFSFLGIVQKSMTLLVSKAFQRTFLKTKRRIEGKIYGVLLVIPMLTIIIGSYLMRIEFSKPTDKIFVSYAVPFLMLINLVVFFVIEKTSRIQYDNYELNLLREKLNMEKKYYDRLDEIEQQQVAVRHDIKHYISVLKALSREGNLAEIDRLLEQFDQGMQKITPKTYVANRIANALFSEKENLALHSGIRIDFETEPHVDLGMISELDLISILGNLLDNAIRAEKESGSAERTVHLRLFEGDGNFNILNVTNHFTKIRTDGRRFLSTKNEEGEHGIGLRNVRRLSEKYNGIMTISTDNGIFDVTICLPKMQKMPN